MKSKYIIGIGTILLLLVSGIAYAGLFDKIGTIFGIEPKPVKVEVTIDQNLKDAAEAAKGTSVDEGALLDEAHLQIIEKSINEQYFIALNRICLTSVIQNNRTILQPLDKQKCLDRKKLIIDYINTLNK